jgi:hypothetical protein
MRRLLTGLAGAIGLAWLWRFLHPAPAAPQVPAADPAEELRAKLEQARTGGDDRDEFDAAEGQPLDEVGRSPAPASAEPEPAEPEPSEQALSLDERRRAVHEKAQQALGEMDRLGRDD